MNGCLRILMFSVLGIKVLVIKVLALSILAWLPLSMTSAKDWPQYRGLAADGKSLDTVVNVDWPASGPRLLWKQPTPLGFSSFSIADGRVFTLIARENAADELTQTCIAMDADTGQELWHFDMSKSEYPGGGGAGAPGNRGGDGPRSTPTVDGDRIYVYDSELQISCLSAATGSLLWQRDVLQDFEGRKIAWSNATSPVIDGDMLFLAGGGPGESLIALDKMNGEVVWKNSDERMTHANPVLATIHGQKQLIYFLQSGLVAVAPANGDELWRTEFPYSTSSAAMPVVAGELVYCSAGYGVGAGLFRISHSMSVENVWRKPNKLMNHWSTPVFHEGHLYGIYEFKKYGKAPLQCVELATGDIKWKQRGFGPGNCIIVGDKVIALSDSGELVIAKATPTEYVELSRAKVLEGKCWSTPAYSAGHVYIRSTQEGACVQLD